MDETPPRELRPNRILRVARVGAAVWLGLRQFFFSVLPVVGLAALLFLLVREMRRNDIEVAPIAVPAKLADAGLTPEVIALRLLDQLEATARVVRTESVERPTTELAGAQPDFNVPIAGLSLRSTAQLLRRVLGYQERRVTGEVILTAGDQLSLRLRISGHGQVADLHGYPVNAVDRLLQDAAPLVWRPLLPRLYAWWVADMVEDQQQVRDRLTELRRGPVALDAGTDRSVTFLIARSLVRSGRARDALPLFDELVTLHPSWPGSWSGRALARASLNQGAAAIEDLRRAIAIDPRWVAAHAQLSRLLREYGRPAEALTAAQAALALDADDITAQVTRIEALRDMKRLDEALVLAQRMAGTHGHNVAVKAALASVLVRKRDYAAALEVFDAGLAIAPGSGGLLGGRAETLLAMNRLDDALIAATAAVELAPRSWVSHNARGWVLRRLGRHGEALAAFERASQLSERSLWPRYGRAVALASLGRRDDAMAELRRVVDADPDNITNARADLERARAQ